MLGSLRKFFEERVATGVAGPTPETREHGLRVAAAALLFEVVRADGKVKDEELTVMRTVVQSTFGLDREQAEELVRLGAEASRDTASVYEFTEIVDRELPAEEKKRLVELLWLVAFADAEKQAYEEQMVRRIAGLLHVTHPDFIDAKIRARSATQTDQ